MLLAEGVVQTTGEIKSLTAKTDKVISQSARRFRLLLLVSAGLFPLWSLLLHFTAPTTEYSLELRLLISGLALAITGLSYYSERVYRYLERCVFLLALVIITVVGYQAHINNLDAPSALGYTVVAFGVALTFESRRLLLAYLIYTVVVSTLVGGDAPQFPRLLFVSFNVCTLLMAGLAFYDKLQLLSSLQRRSREQEISRTILNEVQNVAKMGGWSFKLKNQTLWWSDQTYQIHELKPSTRVTMAMATEFLNDQGRKQFTQAIDLAAEQQVPFDLELPLETALGHARWVRITGKAEVEPGMLVIRRLIGSIQDITLEKELKDELVAREAYIRAVIDAIPGYVSWTDDELRYGGVNKTLAEAFHITPEDFINQPMGFRTPGEDDAVTAFMRTFFQSRDVSASREVTTQSGGAERSILLSAKKYHGGKGAVLIGLDITSRKRFEQELLEQKELLGQILDHVPHGIYAKDVRDNYRYVMWNKRMETMTGRGRQQLINRTDHVLYSNTVADHQRQIDSHVIATAKIFDQPEELLPTVDGKTLPIHVMRVPVFNAKGEATMVLGVVEDITERIARDQLIHTQQMQLLHASKMSTLGEMSGGIAHEINNPLTVIMGFAARLASATAKEEVDLAETRRYAERIVSMTERIAKIVRGLKTFAREASLDPFEPVSVQEIVHDSIELCHERFVNNGVRLDLPPAGPDITFACRAVQISQVLVNLMNNAFDAVQPLPEKWVRIEVKDLGDCVFFAVTDSGSGIPEAIAAKVLHPFFTTKAVGQGTGLGLSISRGIVESHRGNLYYDASNKNTSFVFIVPKEQVKELSPPQVAAA